MDAYSKIPKLYGMENITTEEVTDKLDMFQPIFRKVDDFGWWDMERIQTDAGMQVTYKEFQKGPSIRGLWLELEKIDHKEMNGQVEVTCRTFQTIAHLIMLHTRVSERYIHFN